VDAGTIALEVLGGLVVGLSLGLIGAGGAILSMPIFVIVLGHGTQVAILEALVTTGVIAAFSGMRSAFAKSVDYARAAAFALPGLAGAWVGGPLGRMLDDRAQAGLFAALALVAAWRLLLPQPQDRAGGGDGGAVPALRGRTLAIALVTGFGIGVLTSILGVGGGFLLVPALVLITQVPIKLAVGTSLLVIAVNSGVAFASNARSSPEAVDGVAWSAVAIVAGFGIVGSLLGARFATRLPAGALRKAFAAALVLVAAAVVMKTVHW
jgi:uncharacterized membrane protein YfcA